MNISKKMLFSATALSLGFLTACGGSTGNTGATGGGATTGGATADGSVTIEFWAAPNPTQEVYWRNIAQRFMEETDGIIVNVSQMQETPSSEAGILTAIAGNAAPTMSENISRSFAAQLADSEAIIPLNGLSGWDTIVTNRHMTEVMNTWEFEGGRQYVLPVSSNAMLFAWRIDILRELGFDEVPQTYAEIMAVAEQLNIVHPDMYIWAKGDLARPDGWMRWFDFFMLYNAASNGNPFIDGDAFVADETAGIATLQFMQDLLEMDALLARDVTDPFERGQSIFADLGPWSFSMWGEMYPELQYGENFLLSRPPVPTADLIGSQKTFADTKGIVIYAQASEEQVEAAMTFLNWVYENEENDLEWLNITNLPPARDDLSTNPVFQGFFEQNPHMVPYAEAIPYAIPAINNANYNNLQVIISEQAVNPVVRGEIDAVTAWHNMAEALIEALR